jgi:hypothetical protein
LEAGWLRGHKPGNADGQADRAEGDRGNEDARSERLPRNHEQAEHDQQAGRGPDEHPAHRLPMVALLHAGGGEGQFVIALDLCSIVRFHHLTRSNFVQLIVNRHWRCVWFIPVLFGRRAWLTRSGTE